MFLSTFWKELFKIAGTQLKHSTAYHPETNGQTEVVNRCLETYLRCLSSDHPRAWFKYLYWAELWYNTNFHSSLQATPLHVVYGRDAPTLLRFQPGSTLNSDLEIMLRERDQMLPQIQYHLTQAQQLMKNNADKHKRDLEFQVGDMVLLKLRPFRQKSVDEAYLPDVVCKVLWPY